MEKCLNYLDQREYLNKSQGATGTSDKYQVIKTGDLVKSLESKGYEVTKLEWAGVRNPDKIGFQKHLIRLTHPDLSALSDGLRPELVIINSYDGKCSFNVMLGVFRFICSNGLIVGDTYKHERIRHVGKNTPEQVLQALESVAGQLPQVTADIKLMQDTEVFSGFKRTLIERVIGATIGFNKKGERTQAVPTNSIFTPGRNEDRGLDMFTAMNVFQENYLKGCYNLNKLTFEKERQHVIKKRQLLKARPVKSINRVKDFNQSLWSETLNLIKENKHA